MLTKEEIERLRRSLTMAPTLPADELARLLQTVRRILERGCCRDHQQIQEHAPGEAR